MIICPLLGPGQYRNAIASGQFRHQISQLNGNPTLPRCGTDPAQATALFSQRIVSQPRFHFEPDVITFFFSLVCLKRLKQRILCLRQKP